MYNFLDFPDSGDIIKVFCWCSLSSSMCPWVLLRWYNFVGFRCQCRPISSSGPKNAWIFLQDYFSGYVIVQFVYKTKFWLSYSRLIFILILMCMFSSITAIYIIMVLINFDPNWTMTYALQWCYGELDKTYPIRVINFLKNCLKIFPNLHSEGLIVQKLLYPKKIPTVFTILLWNSPLTYFDILEQFRQ